MIAAHGLLIRGEGEGKLKVAFVAPEDLPVPPTQGGSVQIYLHALIRQLKSAHAVDVILITPRRSAHGRMTSRTRAHDAHYRVHTTGQKAYQRQVVQLLKRLRPDVIQVDNRPKFAVQLKKLFGCPVVLNLHSTTFLGPQNIDQRRVRPGLRLLDSVVVNSHFLRKTVAARFQLATGDWRPVVIYPGIDLDRFSYRERVFKEFSADNPLRVLFVGRVIAQKGVHVLVRAVRQLTDAGLPVRLTVVGRTPPWERSYERRVKRFARGYPIRWTGFIPPQALAQCYARHQIFICPSQSKEAFGLVNLEAMASGLPVIASGVGGIPEAVGDAGILVEPPFDAKSFQQAITALLHHPATLRTMSERGRRRAQQFTWDQAAHEFIALYRRVGAVGR